MRNRCPDCFQGCIDYRGVLANEILADKITVLSGIRMFRRSKDLVDVYALTHCVKVLTIDIFEIIESKHLELGKFAEFMTRRDDVGHAYTKLQGVEGKPPFEDVYLYLTKLIYPFALRDRTPRTWDYKNQVWTD